jgi:hypothetical protein
MRLSENYHLVMRDRLSSLSLYQDRPKASAVTAADAEWAVERNSGNNAAPVVLSSSATVEK